ncbi:MAG: type 1 glutamine amidotransferase [Nitrospirota bacterium]
MNVLILQNVTSEGPGTMADHLAAAKASFTIIDLEQGQFLPAIDAYTHLIIMGGPMAVYEMDRTPYLWAEAKFIEKAVKAGKHVLGVCLGAQMLAHALGARVYPGGAKEIGWYDVDLTDDGMTDPCMAGLAVTGTRTAKVFQWHGDTFDLPEGAVRLASSGLYPNQAFRYSDRVYALQFHIEVTPAIVHGWLRNEKGIDFPLIDTRSQEIYGPYRKRAEAFYRAFFGI